MQPAYSVKATERRHALCETTDRLVWLRFPRLALRRETQLGHSRALLVHLSKNDQALMYCAHRKETPRSAREGHLNRTDELGRHGHGRVPQRARRHLLLQLGMMLAQPGVLRSYEDQLLL